MATNWALSILGATIAVDSTHAGTASALINGVRNSAGNYSSGGWQSGSNPSVGSPAWVEITFATARTINEVDIFALSDNYNSTTDPGPTDTTVSFGITDYKVQYWNGSGWVDAVTVTGNNLIWTKHTGLSFTTTKIRVLITAATGGFASLVEVEAWGASVPVMEFKVESISAANNDPVGSWVDTVAGYTLSNSGSSRPLYKTGITATGKPVVRFDGADDFLNLYIGGGAPNIQHLFIVAKWRNADHIAGDRAVLFHHNGASGDLLDNTFYGDQLTFVGTPTGTVLRKDGVDTPNIDNSNFAIYEVAFGSNLGSTTYIDIGGYNGSPWPGAWDICYIVAYSGEVTGTQLTDLRQSLRDTYIAIPPLTITTSTPLPAGTSGSSYSQLLVSSGGLGSVSYAKLSGSSDVFVSGTHVVSPILGAAGSRTITVRATDSIGSIADKTFTFTVNAEFVPAGLSISRSRFRYDSTLQPRIYAGGFTQVSFLKIGEWFYKKLAAPLAFSFGFANRSEPDLQIRLRETVSTFTTTNGTGVTGSGSGAYVKSGTSVSGAYRTTALDIAKCSFQAKAVSKDLVCGISLQNGTSTIVHDYTNVGVKHAIKLNKYGLGEIWEAGSIVAVDPHFKYDVGETVLIELIAGIVRYYLVHADETMTLLRQTRSKLSVNPKPELMLYDDTASLTDVYAFETDASEDATSIEIIGVLNDFQDWRNDFAISSTADQLQMADNEPEFTFPNGKRTLRSISPNLGRRDKADRLAYEDFFNWHGTEREFIYVDKAKTDAANEYTEFWARFTSAFGDKSINACLSAHSATITETYKRDYVPRELLPTL